jgi:hypothetical protein
MPASAAHLSASEVLTRRYRDVRQRTERLCAPLAIEDHVPQPVGDVSPPKWHLGHTAWFFETMVLRPNLPGYRVFHERFGFVFNSYYETVGERVQRVQRGDLSRPTVAEVLAYRAHVDAAMGRLLAAPLSPELAALIELGLQHEQQHQELLLTDIKFILGVNPLAPEYDPGAIGAVDVAQEHAGPGPVRDAWVRWPGGLCEIGHAGSIGNAGAPFAFDNEVPRHTVLVPPVELPSGAKTMPACPLPTTALATVRNSTATSGGRPRCRWLPSPQVRRSRSSINRTGALP